MRRTMLMIMLAALVSVNAGIDMEIEAFTLIKDYRQAQEVMYTDQDPYQVQYFMHAADSTADRIADSITDALREGNRNPLHEFLSVYNKPEVHDRIEFREPLNMVADRVTEFLRSHPGTNTGLGYRKIGTGRFQPQLLFPGYGYPDPDYAYRKGCEQTREVLSVYWKKIEKTFDAGNRFKAMLEVGASLKFAPGAKVKQLGEVKLVNVEENIKEMVECEITLTEKIVTTCTVKCQKTKVWYHLYRAEKHLLGLYFGEWRKAGRTYEITEEESGMPVVESPGPVLPKS